MFWIYRPTGEEFNTRPALDRFINILLAQRYISRRDLYRKLMGDSYAELFDHVIDGKEYVRRKLEALETVSQEHKTLKVLKAEILSDVTRYSKTEEVG